MIHAVDTHFTLPLMSRPRLRFLTSLMRRPMSTMVNASACSISGKPRVLVISGPTGAGKTRLALELAKRLGGEIISADSVQVYRGLDVGSAKPPASDREIVPHHLLDILNPSDDYSAGQFFEDARKATRGIVEKGRVPIVAGGTGLYLRWFIYGKPDVPRSSAEVAAGAAAELEEMQRCGNWDAAVELVAKAGDTNARSLPCNNWYRLRRSLEVIRSSGSPPSAFPVPYDSFKGKVERELEYDFVCLFLSSPRVELYRSIDSRCEEMLADTKGLLSEASWLLDIGLRPDMNPATRAIGYRQAMEYLLECRLGGGASSPDSFFAFLSDFQKASRNFAKRQMTWFRNELIYHWIDASQPFERVVESICSAYGDGEFSVPYSLKMKKEATGQQETYELKSYRTKNRRFIEDEDCRPILNWVQRTQHR